MVQSKPPDTEAELESGPELSSNGSQPEPTQRNPQSAISIEFEQLDQQMRSKLQRLAWVIVKDWSLAADAVQNSFLTLHQKWHQIPPENRIGWLVKAVQYSAHNLRRAQSTSEQLHDAMTWQPFDQNSSAIGSRLDLEEQMQWAMSQLTDLQREVVQLKLVEGLTFQEIADRLSIPLGTALSRMRLAMERLRTTLKESPNE